MLKIYFTFFLQGISSSHSSLYSPRIEVVTPRGRDSPTARLGRVVDGFWASERRSPPLLYDSPNSKLSELLRKQRMQRFKQWLDQFVRPNLLYFISVHTVFFIQDIMHRNFSQSAFEIRMILSSKYKTRYTPWYQQYTILQRLMFSG